MSDEQLARAIRADVRREILHVLSNKDKISVKNIAEKLNITEPSASKHLKILYDLNIIDFEKQAQEKLYFLKITEIKDLNEIYSQISQKIQWKTYESDEFKFVKNKVIIKIKDTICDTPRALVTSEAFKEVVHRSINDLSQRKSIILHMFESDSVSINQIQTLISLLEYLVFLPIEQAIKLVPNATCFMRKNKILSSYIEYLYNYWRSFDRFVISIGTSSNRFDKRPYRTFNSTVETMNHLIRQTYRDIQENIFDKHPSIYRQIRAGAGFAGISVPRIIPMPRHYETKLKDIGILRQILLNPPIVLEPPQNKRTGGFLKVDRNPLDFIDLRFNEWLCYPAKVGPLIILVYFHEKFYELGFSLSNLFEMANNEDLRQKPDGVYLFGVDSGEIDQLGKWSTVFYEDLDNEMLVAAVPNREEFGYFGYLKKMILTLHNVQMLKQGYLPFHGSLTRIIVDGTKDFSVLIIGDSGAGKSETLEAFRQIGGKSLSDIIVIADDMGSLKCVGDEIYGYGTEIGAFLRLDDLSPSSTFGTIDRAIFMSVNQVNSRIIIPVTTFDNVISGTKIDYVFYANNYEAVDENHPFIEKFANVDSALAVFREGAVMSKGTTTSTGLQRTYFSNIFGIPYYKDLHEELAIKFFTQLHSQGVFIGQIRTQLGIKNMEKTGPLQAAENLIQLFNNSL